MAGVVGPLHRALVAEAPLVDELVVIDSDSTDATADATAEAAAPAEPDVRPRAGGGRGPVRRRVPGRLPAAGRRRQTIVASPG